MTDGIEPEISSGYRSRTTARDARVTHADGTDSAPSSVSAEEGAASAARRHEHRVSKRLTIPLCHHAPCAQSEATSRTAPKEKLKAAFIGSSASEIKALKARGVEITDTVEVPEVAFTFGHDDRLGCDRATGSSFVNRPEKKTEPSKT